jgi:hypothetical protein
LYFTTSFKSSLVFIYFMNMEHLDGLGIIVGDVNL